MFYKNNLNKEGLFEFFSIMVLFMGNLPHVTTKDVKHNG